MHSCPSIRHVLLFSHSEHIHDAIHLVHTGLVLFDPRQANCWQCLSVAHTNSHLAFSDGPGHVHYHLCHELALHRCNSATGLELSEFQRLVHDPGELVVPHLAKARYYVFLCADFVQERNMMLSDHRDHHLSSLHCCLHPHCPAELKEE